MSVFNKAPNKVSSTSAKKLYNPQKCKLSLSHFSPKKLEIKFVTYLTNMS